MAKNLEQKSPNLREISVSIWAICQDCQDLFPEILRKGEKVAPLNNPGERLWRTDIRLGRNIYALLSNDVNKPSQQDPLLGTMENSELAEMVVDIHNKVLLKFGRHYLKALTSDG